MKQKFSIAFSMAFILMLVMTSVVGAQYTGYSWVTAYQVVNMGSLDADITIQYYDASGNEVLAARKTIYDVAPGAATVVVQYTDDPNLPQGQYSAVVSADQPVAAVVNQQLVQNGLPYYGPTPPFSSYSGEANGSLSITLPTIQYNWYDYYTEFFVMNVGSADATNVDIAYYPSNIGGSQTGAAGVTDLNIAIDRFASYTKSQKTDTRLAQVGGTFNGRFFGSAVITSDQNIIVVVNQHNTNKYKLFSYNGFASSSIDWVMPTHMRGWFDSQYTNLQINNPDPALAAEVDITYTPGLVNGVDYNLPAGQAPLTVHHSIPARTSLSRYDGPGATDAQSDLDDAPNWTRFYGSVKVHSTNGVAVLIQTNVEAANPGPGQAGALNGFPLSSATLDVVVPTIKADFYGAYTTLTIQNTTGTAGTCTITYSSDSTYSAQPNQSKGYVHTLPANGIITVYEGRSGGAEIGDINHDTFWRNGTNWRFLGSAVIHCSQNVVAFVNDESVVANKDSLYTFNAINK